LNFFWVEALAAFIRRGVSFFVVDLLILASDIGVMFHTGSGFKTVAILDPAGIDSLLLGSHADLSSPEFKNTHTLLKVDAVLPLLEG
jgi:hypothetical protein